MKIFKPFGQNKGRKTEITELCLQSIRFRKLLENARAINDLFEDGAEKMGGEYIFDRHFVTTLVDRVIERMGMIVFDACVLAPKGGAILYALYDDHKEIARRHFLRTDGPLYSGELAVSNKDLLEEPEYRLLASALSWMTGPSDTNHMTIVEFLKTVFDNTITGLDEGSKSKLESLYPLRLKAYGMENLIGFVDVRGGLSNSEGHRLSSHDLNCRPLGLLLAEVVRKASRGENVQTRTDIKWLAAVSDEHLSLRSADKRGGVRLETTFSGYRDSDYVFFFVKRPTDPEEFLPDGFRIEKTDLGAMCWSYNVPGGKIEDDLIYLGRWLFGTVEL